MKYVFGVMSNKWSLDADDKDTAYMSMCLFIQRNVPIAVYEPEEAREAFMPLDILKKNIKNDKSKVGKCLESIKKIV